MRLTYELIEKLGTLNSYQLRLLGIGWPPKRGWIHRLVGKWITEEVFQMLVELRGPRKKVERIEILRRHGLSARTLFQKRISD